MKVNIKGKPYKVELKKDTFLDNDTALAGLCSYEKQKITISTKYENQTPKTIYHELLHAFFYECGLTVYAHDETLVEWIANNIAEINDCALNILTYIKAVGNER